MGEQSEGRSYVFTLNLYVFILLIIYCNCDYLALRLSGWMSLSGLHVCPWDISSVAATRPAVSWLTKPWLVLDLTRPTMPYLLESWLQLGCNCQLTQVDFFVFFFLSKIISSGKNIPTIERHILCKLIRFSVDSIGLVVWERAYIVLPKSSNITETYLRCVWLCIIWHLYRGLPKIVASMYCCIFISATEKWQKYSELQKHCNVWQFWIACDVALYSIGITLSIVEMK